MPSVWIPPLLQKLTAGAQRVQADGATVREVIASLDQVYPGIRDKLCEGDRIRPGIAVAVDGQITPEGLRSRLDAASELHFLPALAGG